MAENNGRNSTIKWLIGILVTLIIFIALPTMASQIWTNDRLSRDRDTKLRDLHSSALNEMVNRDEKITVCFSEKIDSINEKISDIKSVQTRNTTLLEKIDKKL